MPHFAGARIRSIGLRSEVNGSPADELFRNGRVWTNYHSLAREPRSKSKWVTVQWNACLRSYRIRFRSRWIHNLWSSHILSLFFGLNNIWSLCILIMRTHRLYPWIASLSNLLYCRTIRLCQVLSLKLLQLMRNILLKWILNLC